MSAGEGFEQAPDGIVPLVGYRMWQVKDEDGEPLFLPLNLCSRDWGGATQGWVSASCWVGNDRLVVSPDGELVWGDPSQHRVPDEGCSCGFYAMKELDAQLLHAAGIAVQDAQNTGTEEVFVLGRVELAGKVIEHERGYRAERARIVELIPLRDQQRTIEAIARRAGIGVAQPVRVPPVPFRDRVRLLRFAWAASKATPPPPASPAQRRNDQVFMFILWGCWVAFRVWSFAHEAGGVP
jgi:hypothetical protein